MANLTFTDEELMIIYSWAEHIANVDGDLEQDENDLFTKIYNHVKPAADLAKQWEKNADG